MRTLAIIPARGGSKRLPGKNTKPLLGKPLIGWTIEFAKTIPWFDEIQVSTDSKEIAAECARFGTDVARLRPAALATDEATSVDVALDVLEWRRSAGAEFDVIVLLQPTTPVRVKARWDEAYAKLADSGCDGVVGVTEAATHPYLVVRDVGDGHIEPWDAESVHVTRSQDYPPAYQINGAMYCVKVDTFVRQRSFIPEKCCYVVCPEKIENVDIDTKEDWESAERLLSACMVRD